ncbi:MAG: hypothetical protein Q8R34_02075 [bacterium]|nr:hypothetical protein [bacterium]
MFKENQNEKVLTESRPESIEVENSKLEVAVNFTGKEINDWMETTERLEPSYFKTKVTTFLVGLFLAFGAMGETAQAQDWRRVATRGVESVVVNAEREKSSQYIEEFKREEKRINLAEEELYQKYRQVSDELSAKRDESGLQELEKGYAMERAKLAEAREKNLKDYKTKMEKQRTRHQIFGGIRDVLH